jgi:hypothetical protein
LSAHNGRRLRHSEGKESTQLGDRVASIRDRIARAFCMVSNNLELGLRMFF